MPSGLSTLVFAAFLASGVQAQTDDQKLREQIKREVLEELRTSDFLREQIALGIKDYRQQEERAKAAAAAERVRAANQKLRAVRPFTPGRDHVYGDPNAPVSLIEYSDYECPFCKRFHATPKALVDASAGKVNWVYRHLPLDMHKPGAQKQAEASECIGALGGNEAFWRFTDAIYQRTRSGGSGFPSSQLMPLAAEIGVKGDAFQQCMDAGRFTARVNEDFAEAASLGIGGTPATLVRNNRTGEVQLKSGAVAAAAVQADIDILLK